MYEKFIEKIASFGVKTAKGNFGNHMHIDTELDGAVGMNSGIFNNPFIIWGKYRKKLFKYYLPISFQFHHTQMDGAHAGRFLSNLQKEINSIK